MASAATTTRITPSPVRRSHATIHVGAEDGRPHYDSGLFSQDIGDENGHQDFCALWSLGRDADAFAGSVDVGPFSVRRPTGAAIRKDDRDPFPIPECLDYGLCMFYRDALAG